MDDGNRYTRMSEPTCKPAASKRAARAFDGTHQCPNYGDCETLRDNAEEAMDLATHEVRCMAKEGEWWYWETCSARKNCARP